MKKKSRTFRSTLREASQFHEMAWPFLSGLAFDLVNDPSVIRSPYQATRATYKSKWGLFLVVGFNPADGNYAVVACGRQWREQSGWSCLSNHYSALAKQFGLEIPRTYKLGYGSEIPKTMEMILEDLENTLPIVLERVTLDDLVSIESAEFGAQRKATSSFGPNYSQRVEMSRFCEASR